MHFVYAHLIGDYLIQNDWMAKGKKGNIWIALIHAVTYLIPFFFIGASTWQLTLIVCQHMLQDYSNFVVWFMKITGHRQFVQPPMAPWSIILTDNIFHILWIAFVMNLEI